MAETAEHRTGRTAAILRIAARVLAAGVLPLFLAPALLAQNWVSTERGTSTIRGRVLAADGGAPLPRAEVRLTRGDRPSVVLLTDALGRYAFTQLPAGGYGIGAGRAGYLTMKYGQRRPTGPARLIQIADGESHDRVDFALARAGAIEVSVVDERGEPRDGVIVQAKQFRFTNGGRDLVAPVPGDLSQRNFVTDDRGQLRLYDLAPGDYYLTARPRLARVSSEHAPGAPGRRRVVDPPTFYPGGSSASEAQPVTLMPGQELRVRMQMLAATPLARLTGRVMRDDGSLMTAGTVTLSPLAGSAAGPVPAASASLTGKGFEFPNVPAGQYLIERNPIHDQPRSGEYGVLPVTVSGTDIPDLLVTTGEAASIRGRVVPDAGAAPASWKSEAISLRLIIPNGYAEVDVDEDGSFTRVGLTGVSSGWTVARGGWFLKAVTLDGRDITDAPMRFSSAIAVGNLKVVLTRKSAGVSGTVHDGGGGLVTDCWALIFSENAARWTPASRFIATARVDRNGRFTIAGLPEGRYAVAALGELEPGEEYDPALLRRLTPRAAAVTLGEGESKVVNLRLVTF